MDTGSRLKLVRESYKLSQRELARRSGVTNATISLIEGARALAFLRGRPYALPQDLIDLVPDVLRHRLVLNFHARAEGVDADDPYYTPSWK